MLIADVISLSDSIIDNAASDQPGITRTTLAGPLNRADAPMLPLGAVFAR